MNTADLTLDYDGSTDDSTDMDMRGVSRIARRNRRLVGILAECGHCGDILDTGKAQAVAHVEQCERDNRPYQYGR